MKKSYCIKVKQYIGDFYLASLPVEEILKIGYISNRKGGGIERFLSKKRVKEISEYCNSPDATFPTPIIIAIDKNIKYAFASNSISYDENEFKGEIIDGQHRLEGIKLYSKSHEALFDLPVVFMFELEEEQKAYVFSIINSKQTKVSRSHIFDLFDLSSIRTPFKIAHDMAKLLHNDTESALYKRIKMLGVKDKEYKNASLSQGAFAKYFLPLVSKKPSVDEINIKNKIKLEDISSCPLRKYFIENQDEIIYKILFNMFNALRETFRVEWENPNDYILSKTIGYAAIMKAFPTIYVQGSKQKELTIDFFKNIFDKFKSELDNQEKKLTSEFFPGSAQNINQLSKILKETIDIS